VAEGRASAFVDLAAFTALTDAPGDHAEVDQIAGVGDLAQRAHTGSALIVKSIGDVLHASQLTA